MSRALSAFLVGVLVLSTLSVGATGTVAAQDGGDIVKLGECDGWLESLGNALPGSAFCGVEDVERDATGNLIESWYAVEGWNETFYGPSGDGGEIASIENSITYFESFLREEAQTYFAAQVANESVETTAKARANTVSHIRGLGAEFQKSNIIALNERFVGELAAEAAASYDSTNGSDGVLLGSTLSEGNTSTATLNLVNGETQNYSRIEAGVYTLSLFDGATDPYGHSGVPDEDGLSETSYEPPAMMPYINEIDTLVSNEVSNVETLSSNIDSETFDDLNESDILTPTQAAEKYGSEGGAGWASVVGSSLGIQQNFEGEAVLNVDGENFTGIVGMNNPLISDVDGNDEYDATLEEGEVLDLSTRNGTLYTTLTDGSGEIKTWDSATDVTVEEVTAENTSTLGFDSDELEAYNVSVADEYVQQYAEIRENASEFDTTGGSCGILCFGGSGGDGGTPIALIAVLAILSLGAVGVVGYVALKD